MRQTKHVEMSMTGRYDQAEAFIAAARLSGRIIHMDRTSSDDGLLHTVKLIIASDPTAAAGRAHATSWAYDPGEPAADAGTPVWKRRTVVIAGGVAITIAGGLGFALSSTDTATGHVDQADTADSGFSADGLVGLMTVSIVAVLAIRSAHRRRK